MNRSKTFLRAYQGFVVAGLLVAGLGCTPSNLLWFLNRDDKAPAMYPLEPKDGKKEYTVAVVVTAKPELLYVPEFSGIDRELAVRFSHLLTEETAKDKQKVTVVDQSKVNQLKQKLAGRWDIQSRSEIAKELGADHLIEIDISKFSLYDKTFGRDVCKGTADVNVKVYDAKGNGSAKTEYPWTSTPPLRPTDGSNPMAYKQILINHLAKDLMHKHVPHTADRDMPSQIR
jgi:hypothetical protein